MRTVIKVEDLSKAYLIGHQEKENYTTFRDLVIGSLRGLREKLFSPFNSQNEPNPTLEEFWALKCVSFEVKQGDRLGIIGRNGAGKSTLLKILSRVVSPTSGRYSLKGRVSSLLEVGTGFHSELTGRENIFLNGSVLGMRRSEIIRKFDEIVSFAEIEKFLDTPVKRYSSGMYVRLAFAVAAHLEPEILIVDEVLAVGDFQFQKKCLGKMEAMGKDGRTLLFVSHNMGIINKLCNIGIYLENGKIVRIGKIEDTIKQYLEFQTNDRCEVIFGPPTIQHELFIKSVTIGLEGANFIISNKIPFLEPFIVKIAVEAVGNMQNTVLGIGILNSMGEVITTIHTQEIGIIEDEIESAELINLHKGINIFQCHFSPNFLRPGSYSINISVFNRKLIKNFDVKESCIYFEISQYSSHNRYFDERQSGLAFLSSGNWVKEK